MSTQFAPVWNASGVNFSAIRANVTDIASSGGSTLLDLRVNDSGVFSVNKTGAVTFAGNSLQGLLDGKLSLAGGTLTGAVTSNLGTITTSTPALSISQTWNNAAVNFSLIDGSITPTAASASYWFNFTSTANWGAGGLPFFRASARDGAIEISSMWGQGSLLLGSHAIRLEGIYGTGFVIKDYTGNAIANINTEYSDTGIQAERAAMPIGWSGLKLRRDAADTLALQRSTNAQRFNLYGTYTDGSNYRRLYISSTTAGAFTIGVEGAGTGASGNTLNIGPGITIDRGGFVISVESSLILATTVLQLNSDTGQLRGRNGRIILSDNATGSTFDLLRFGGITNSFPAIKRNGTALNFRLADDSADAPITASNGTFSGALSAVTKSFLIDHPTKPGRKLQYGSLESPYHGIRLTGRSFVEGGIGVIELPDYVRAFVSDDVNIQLTPVGRNILWVDCIDLNNNQVIVGADSDGDFYWSFTGIRTDVELEVEPWA